MKNTFPALSIASLNAANRLAQWLAEDDFSDQATRPPIDIVVLAGNAVIPTIDAACQLAAERAVPLLISGGIGHSTPFLYDAVRHDPRYHQLAVAMRPEAHILADIARQFWQIPAEKIVIEDRSTNCGENARFTREKLASLGDIPRCGVVLQDPTLQRRTMATFARAWQDATFAPRWYSLPGYTPQLANTDSGLTFVDNPGGLWPVERYLSLLLGELPRLQDNPQGYGPRGKDFITHVDIPADIMAAGEQLITDPLLKNIVQR
ncbi:YdcF family protein [Enterobacteriaceae bacterium ESL0689]|nr:YdcF family protein [Enterobacteriaceae bacterium ESL0689]